MIFLIEQKASTLKSFYCILQRTQLQSEVYNAEFEVGSVCSSALGHRRAGVPAARMCCCGSPVLVAGPLSFLPYLLAELEADCKEAVVQ